MNSTLAFVLLAFIDLNILITFLWCLFARAGRKVIRPYDILKYHVRPSRIDYIIYLIRIIFGRLNNDNKDKVVDETQEVRAFKALEFYHLRAEATKDMYLPVFIGVDDQGKPRWIDLATQPHMLIGGMTNHGKSVAIRTIIDGLADIDQSIPLEIIAIDGKSTELYPFKYEKRRNIEVLCENDEGQFGKKIIEIQQEIKKRNNIIRQASCTNIQEYNRDAKAFGYNPMPYKVLLIDEFDLVYLDGDDKETVSFNNKVRKALLGIAKRARSCGIHLILCTQNPSARVVHPDIRAQLGGIITFRLQNEDASKRVLGTKVCDLTANKLSRAGEFLFVGSNGEKFKGRTPLTLYEDFGFYKEYKEGAVFEGDKRPNTPNGGGRYAPYRHKAKDYILSLLGKNEEVTLHLDDLGDHLGVDNDKKFRESIVGPTMAHFSKCKSIKDGNKITGYKIFSNQSKQQKNDNNHP